MAICTTRTTNASAMGTRFQSAIRNPYAQSPAGPLPRRNGPGTDAVWTGCFVKFMPRPRHNTKRAKRVATNPARARFFLPRQPTATRYLACRVPSWPWWARSPPPPLHQIASVCITFHPPLRPAMLLNLHPSRNLHAASPRQPRPSDAHRATPFLSV